MTLKQWHFECQKWHLSLKKLTPGLKMPQKSALMLVVKIERQNVSGKIRQLNLFKMLWRGAIQGWSHFPLER